ncbi:MAG: hypothetical protein JF609_04155 [Verrucomicrobia bacterium]|nr:hypothetical protein [Verrucomicrobiota bacterium]
MKNVLENYASLASYSDEGRIVATLNGNTSTTTFTTRLARSNFYRIEWQPAAGSSRPAGNTGAEAVWSSGAGNFLEIGRGAQNQISRELALTEAAAASGGATATVPRIFFDMPWGNQGDQLADLVSDEHRQADGQVGGVDCYVFTRELSGRQTTLWIGRQDFLIHQIRTVFSAEAMRAMVTDSELLELKPGSLALTVTETHASIAVNKLFSRWDFVPTFPLSPSLDIE